MDEKNMKNYNLLKELAASIKKSDKPTTKQKKIIESAILIFSEKGYANASTAEIARHAGVSEGTIFKHYGTKENLLLSLIIPYLEDFFPSIVEEVVKEASNSMITFEYFLVHLLQNRCLFIEENKEIFQVMIKELIYKEELKEKLLPCIYQILATQIGQVIEHFQQRGEVKDSPTDVLLKMLFTSTSAFFISHFVLFNKTKVSQEDIVQTAQFIANGMRP